MVSFADYIMSDFNRLSLFVHQCEATYTNKVTKIQKEADFEVHKVI